MEKRSLIAFEHYHEATQKFEYFFTGIIGAICAYSAQNIHVNKISISPNTLELCSVLLLVVSFFSSIKRMNSVILMLLENHRYLHKIEMRSELIQSVNSNYIVEIYSGAILDRNGIQKEIDKFSKELIPLKEYTDQRSKEAKKYYDIRNYFLYAGFLALIVSKIWAAYY